MKLIPLSPAERRALELAAHGLHRPVKSEGPTTFARLAQLGLLRGEAVPVVYEVTDAGREIL